MVLRPATQFSQERKKAAFGLTPICVSVTLLLHSILKTIGTQSILPHLLYSSFCYPFSPKVAQLHFVFIYNIFYNLSHMPGTPETQSRGPGIEAAYHFSGSIECLREAWWSHRVIIISIWVSHTVTFQIYPPLFLTSHDWLWIIKLSPATE